MGNAALKMETGVRRLRPADLEQVIAIDSHQFGEPRRAFFEKRLAQARKHPEDYVQVGVDRNGRGTVVYPNDFDQNNLLEAGKELRVPAEGAPYQFRLREPGKETVVGICLGGPKPPFGIKHDFERQRFTELGDYRAFLIRAATADAQDRNSPAAVAESRSRTARNTKRLLDASVDNGLRFA